jgi:hypothetical protein
MSTIVIDDHDFEDHHQEAVIVIHSQPQPCRGQTNRIQYKP